LAEKDAIEAQDLRDTRDVLRRDAWDILAGIWNVASLTARVSTRIFAKAVLNGSSIYDDLKDYASSGDLPLGYQASRSYSCLWKELRFWWTYLFSWNWRDQYLERSAS